MSDMRPFAAIRRRLKARRIRRGIRKHGWYREGGRVHLAEDSSSVSKLERDVAAAQGKAR